MYSVLLVAKYIIKYCNEKNYSVSNLKLQKLLYFAQAEFLVSTGSPCFPEEIEAWDFGPVVPEVYHRYKVYGSSNIPYISTSLLGRISPPDKALIEDMVDQCAKYTASQLVEITHHQDPWVRAYAPYRSNIITKRSIRDFFAEEELDA